MSDEAESAGYASPACSLGQVDGAYAGYWTAEETSRFVDQVLAREQATIALLRQALPRIGNDALHAQAKKLLELHEGTAAAWRALQSEVA